MIAAAVLIAGFQFALDHGWGYIYGMTHELWSEAKQREYARTYAGNADRQASCQYGGKWAGKWVTDCSGLFKWVFSQNGGTIAHGSNSIWNKYCVAKGNLKNGKRTDNADLKPGTAVFTGTSSHNHIGLYIGGGVVIEAKGTQYGVVKSKITDKRWTCWGELKGIAYQETKEQAKEGGEKMALAKVVLPSGKSGKTVNMRERESTGADVLKQVPVGSVIEVCEDRGQWCRISYAGLFGYMQSNYIEYEGQTDETGNITLEQQERVDKALTEIERIYGEMGELLKELDRQKEIIGEAVGRG